jgi:hypothetical protein
MRIQFHAIGAYGPGGRSLAGLGIHEQADADPSAMEACDGFAKLLRMPFDVPAMVRSQLIGRIRHECALRRPDLLDKFEQLVVERAFHVELYARMPADEAIEIDDIAVLDMPLIGSGMDGYSMHARR